MGIGYVCSVEVKNKQVVTVNFHLNELSDDFSDFFKGGERETKTLISERLFEKSSSGGIFCAARNWNREVVVWIEKYSKSGD